MGDLHAAEAAEGLGLPLELGGCQLSALPCTQVWLVALYPGQRAACDAALAVAGLAFPAPGQVLTAHEARIVWAGRDQAILYQHAWPEALARHAAVTDQADGWAGFRLHGARAESVLARLVPLDLRPAAFPTGTAARSLLGHLPLLLIRDAAQAFEIVTYRSMAGSALHDIARAMRGIAARMPGN